MKDQIARIKEELGGKLSTVSAADGLAVIESSFKKTMKELFTDMKALAPEIPIRIPLGGLSAI